MGDSSSESVAPAAGEDTANQGSVDSTDDVTMTPTANEAQAPGAENDQAETEPSLPAADEAPASAADGTQTNSAALDRDMYMDIPDNEVPLAAEPTDDEGSDEDDGLDLPQARFTVKTKANETIVTNGIAYFIPTTETIPAVETDTAKNDDATTADTQTTESDDNNSQTPATDNSDIQNGEGDDDDSRPVDDKQNTETDDSNSQSSSAESADQQNGENNDGDLQADGNENANGQNQNNSGDNVGALPPEATAGQLQQAEGQLATDTLIQANQNAAMMAAPRPAVPAPATLVVPSLEKTTSNNILRIRHPGGDVNISADIFGVSSVRLCGVLDERIATCAVNGNAVTVTTFSTSEGRTKIWVIDNNGNFRVKTLEVYGVYTLSSAAPYEDKVAIPMVSAYDNHVLALKADGTVSGWGKSDGGELGAANQNAATVQVPADIMLDKNVALKDIIMVSAGVAHSLALTKDGKVYAWGSNLSGQLGTNSIEVVMSQPELVVKQNGDPLGGEKTPIVAIAAGGNFSLALDSDGHVWSWGANDVGQLGIYAEDASRSVATEVKDIAGDPLSNIVQIATGYAFALALDDKGNIWSWGENRGGQLGAGYSQDNMFWAVEAVENDELTISDAGATIYNYPVEIAAGAEGVARVGSGNFENRGRAHMIAVKIERTNTSLIDLDATSLYSWGVGAQGGLGTGNDDNQNSPVLVSRNLEDVKKLVKLAVGYNHSVAVTESGTAYSWGYNDNFQLGHGGTVGQNRNGTNAPLPKEVFGEAGSDGGMLHTMQEAFGTQPVGVAAGNGFTLYWYADGTVRAVGGNSTGALGAIGVNGYGSSVPILTGDGYTENIVLNKVWVYEREVDESTGAFVNDEGVLVGRYASKPGTFNETDSAALTVMEKQLPERLTITDNQYVRIFKEGIQRYYNVGFNLSERDRGTSYTELPGATLKYKSEWPEINVVKPEDIPANVGKEGADMRPTENPMLNTDSQITVTQDGTDYIGGFKIMIKDANNIAVPKVVAGENFVAALRSDGTVWTWGNNDHGQLGINKTAAEVPFASFPVQVKGLEGRTERLTGISDIAVGASHVLAVNSSDGTLYAWGANNNGQLGLGMTNLGGKDLRDRTTPCYVVGAEGEKYLANVTSIAAGDRHSLAVVVDKVYAWGNDERSQLGVNGQAARPDDMTYIYSQPTPVLAGSSGGTQLQKVQKVFAGANQSFAIVEESRGGSTTLYSWGDNSMSQLGWAANTQDRMGIPDQVKQSRGDVPLNDIVSVGVGRDHTLALGKNGRVYVWGSNLYGQMGLAFSQVDPTQPGFIPYGYVGDRGLNRACDLYDENIKVINDAVGVAAGGYHSAIIRGTKDEEGNVLTGKIYTFGLNTNGQLGRINDEADGMLRVITSADATASVVLGEARSEFGTNIYQAVGSISGEVTAADVNSNYSVAVNDAGRVYTWGGGSDKARDYANKDSIGYNYGQLGDMATIDRPRVVETGSDNAIQVYPSGMITRSGAPLTTNPTRLESRMELYVDDVLDITGLAEQNVSRFLLRKTSSPAVPVTTINVTITSADPRIAEVNGTTLVAKHPGVVMVQVKNMNTGNSAVMRVEVMDTVRTTAGGSPVIHHRIPELDIGEGFSVALKTDGTVWTWGNNSRGQLGINSTVTSTNESTIPVEERDVVDVADMTTPVQVRVANGGGMLEDIISVAAGANHAVALAADGTVYTWGDNIHGQLGVACDEWNTSTRVRTGAAEVNGLPKTGIAVYAGNGFSFLLTSSGEVWSWGYNDRGQLG